MLLLCLFPPAWTLDGSSVPVSYGLGGPLSSGVVVIHRNKIILFCMEYILMHSGYMCASKVVNAQDRLQMHGLNSHDTLVCVPCTPLYSSPCSYWNANNGGSKLILLLDCSCSFWRVKPYRLPYKGSCKGTKQLYHIRCLTASPQSHTKTFSHQI